MRGFLGVEAELAGLVAFAREVVVDGDGSGNRRLVTSEEDEVDG